MQTATFAKRRHYAVTVRGGSPEVLSIDNISGRESLKSKIVSRRLRKGVRIFIYIQTYIGAGLPDEPE